MKLDLTNSWLGSVSFQTLKKGNNRRRVDSPALTHHPLRTGTSDKVKGQRSQAFGVMGSDNDASVWSQFKLVVNEWKPERIDEKANIVLRRRDRQICRSFVLPSRPLLVPVEQVPTTLTVAEL